MVRHCTHSRLVRSVTPGTPGCQECLEQDMIWVHLRLCRECGHVGCCDQSIGKHASSHFHATGHPIMEGYDPPEGWGWCYIDEKIIDLPDQTPQTDHIPRYV